MTKEQARHVQAMAKKIIPYAQRIISDMTTLERSTIRELETMPLDNAVNRFQNDSGYGVQDNIEAIQAVIRDMIGELTN